MAAPRAVFPEAWDHSYPTDIENERSHQRLLERLVSFDKSEMKTTKTQEKNVLPTKEGWGARVWLTNIHGVEIIDVINNW